MYALKYQAGSLVNTTGSALGSPFKNLKHIFLFIGLLGHGLLCKKVLQKMMSLLCILFKDTIQSYWVQYTYAQIFTNL